MHSLSLEDARRLALSAQGLVKPPDGLVSLVEQIGALPVDMTATICPSPHLVAWSRLGRSHEICDLDDALRSRSLWEDMDAIRPKRDLPLHLAVMSQQPAHGRTREWLEANELFRAEILDALTDSDEPLLSREMAASPQVPWRSSGWNENRSIVLMLQVLQSLGEVAIDGRTGTQRRWTLAERVYGHVRDLPNPVHASHELDVRRLHGLGIARSSGTVIPGEPIHVGEAGEPATVEGVPGKWRVDVAALERLEPMEGARLLSPFDAIVRDRVRMRDLWGFDYTLEMYKPAAKRRWGYFALPILHADQLVGKLDATADRSAGRLFIDAVHQDGTWSAECRNAVDDEIDALASWLNLRPERATGR